MQVIGLCRFSYPAIGGFQVEHETMEDRIAYLYGDARLEERFRLMEAVALPCIKAQTDEDFELIVVIGDQLPKVHRDRLHDITANIPQIRIHKEPPRPQREVMKEILNNARKDPSEPCLQFRHDDDDAFAVDFIERLRAAVNFDWNKGMVAEFGANGIATADVFRQLFPAAMGMQIRGNSPLTIMNFGHERIARFMPVISFAEPQMFVRGHNAFNDSRQKSVKQVPVKAIDYDQAQMLKDRFAIDVDHVQSVFAGS